MKIAIALTIAVTTFSTLAYALDVPPPPPPDLGYRGEFVRVGDRFTCKLGDVPALKPEDADKVTDQACLYIGPDAAHAFAIGSVAKTLLKRLGEPTLTQPDITGGTTYVFPLGPGDDPPFILVTESHDQIATLQVGGQSSSPALDILAFNHIKLGSNVSEVKERFGAPFTILAGATKTSERWSYLPWTFSFEFTDSKVTSIKITSFGLRQ